MFSAVNTTQLHVLYSLLFAHFASVSFGHNASCFRRASHCSLRIFCLTEASVFTRCTVDEGLKYSYCIQLICILVLFLSKDRQASKCDFKPALLLAVCGYCLALHRLLNPLHVIQLFLQILLIQLEISIQNEAFMTVGQMCRCVVF